MFVQAIKTVTKAMFPIFRFDKVNDSQQKIGVAGTGFFINSAGYFISVAHVFDNKTENTNVLDKCKVNCDNGAGKTRTHDGFLVRDFGLFGMSGGPIVDKKGVVVGMQGSVTQPRVSSNGQRTITVENAIAIRSNLIVEFLVKNKIDIPKQKL